MQLDTLIAGTDARPYPPGAVPRASAAITAITDDSRRVTPGALFVATAGRTHDGTQFIPEAIARGAAAIVTREPLTLPAGVALLVASDPRATGGVLASRFHGDPSRDLAVIGVTGTNGKTSTTYLLQHVLASAGSPTARIGTVDLDLGDPAGPTPATYTTPPAPELHAALARARDNGLTHAAIEVSSQALDQARLAGVDFTAGVFTNLTRDHLDYHGSMEAYAAAKARLFARVRPTGVCTIHIDDPFAGAMIRASHAHVVTYGRSRLASYRAEQVEIAATGSSFVVLYPGGSTPVTSPLVGDFNVLNLLATFATAHALGVDAALIAHSLQTARGAPGRLERVLPSAPRQAAHDLQVFVDYAHTGDALRQALLALRAAGPTRPLTVLFGCGGDRDAGKRPEMGRIAARLADRVIVTSDNPRTEPADRIAADVLAGVPADRATHVTVELDRRAALERAIGEARPGETVLVAGKGHEGYQIVGTQTLPFDDRAICRELLDRLLPGRLSRLHDGQNGSPTALPASA